ncbi:phenylalanine--tRNA ligase subunit alpha [bacterium]|nr:phenylalanine--tRNA ligase subunit alpha [bacterium]
MDFSKVEKIKEQAARDILEAKTTSSLKEIFNRYLGKKGIVAKQFFYLKKMPQPKRSEFGKQLNELKKSIEKRIKEKSRIIEGKDSREKRKIHKIDVSIPSKKPQLGHIHPLTKIIRETQDAFVGMGFSVEEGPEIETEHYNFSSLNFPVDHPSRDAHDTFYLKKDTILRTHTSPVQVRYMEKHNPPFRIIVPGRVFRHEATDSSHEIQFYQLEGLMVGKDISLANLKGVLEEAIKRVFGKKTVFRWRPGYFPFVEPGVEIDIACPICGGKGCSTCKNTGWIEVLGAGMVHPNVFKAAGYNPKNWQGFAFGFGIDRLAMIKYRISDIRMFYLSDMRFLSQF